MSLIKVTLLDGHVLMMPPHAGRYEYLATHEALEERVKDEIYDGIAYAKGVARREKWLKFKEQHASQDHYARQLYWLGREMEREVLA